MTQTLETLRLHALWLANERGGVRANLRGANLRDTDLRDTDLRRADLQGADLRGADLWGADLRRADLWGADLTGVVGNGGEVKSLHISPAYPIAYTADVLQIGCQQHPIADWWAFTDQQIAEMDGKKALKFWREYKTLLQAILTATN